MINIRDLKVGMRVLYKGTMEEGIVSSWNDKYVFVKFDEQVSKFGIDETTAQACHRSQLLAGLQEEEKNGSNN